MKKIFLITIALLFLSTQINVKAMELKHELSNEEYKSLKQYVEQNNLEEIRKLIKDVYLKNIYGTKLLMTAIANRNEPIVKLLLQEGVDVNLKDQHNYTPLIWATRGKQKSIIELLLKNGANPFLKRTYSGNTASGDTAYDLAIEEAKEAKKQADKEQEEDYKEPYEEEYKEYTEISDLLKEWEQKYQKEYKEYLSKLRISTLSTLQKQKPALPKDVIRLGILKKTEPTFEEWFEKIRKK